MYFFIRLRGTNADKAASVARGITMKKVGKIIDARTQLLAKNICSNC